ncbi:MAG: ATP-binding cassette domain-containing protein [Candidatus Heimdallarchaeota archaeon]|nr:ATP-binding cassette domain-containing protein [Candidatus Heimdallarchaeota archaeon]
MIESFDLIKIYEDEKRQIRIPALRGCDFQVERGELVTIIGPSGSGKTTLINILAGQETISSGSVKVDGINLEKLTISDLTSYRLKKISVVDQFPERNLFLNVKVEENLSLFSTLDYKDLSKVTEKRNKEIMVNLGVDHLSSRIVKTLSGGEMIRVAIACAIAKRSPVILCDEPTGQLDRENTQKVKDILSKVSEKYNTTIIVVTHDMRFLEGVDKTYIIKDGRVSAILGKEDREEQSKFPLKFKSHVDSSKSIRIPELIYKTLKFDDVVQFEMTEESEVTLKHPQNITPEKVELTKKEAIRKEVILEKIPKSYHEKRDIVIEIKNLSKDYKPLGGTVHAITDINLKIHSGEFVFIVGPSGSGKSTLLKVLAGLEKESQGEIMILDNKSFTKLSENEKAFFRRNYLGVVMQQGNLHPFLTVAENLYLKDVFTKQKKVQIKEKNFTNLLTLFHILHRQNSYPTDISGGELQRASLAVSFYGSPKILVLDEPTANLDSDLAKTVIENLYKLHQEYNLTILLSTHDLNLINKGNRVIELVDGKIKQDGLAKGIL